MRGSPFFAHSQHGIGALLGAVVRGHRALDRGYRPRVRGAWPSQARSCRPRAPWRRARSRAVPGRLLEQLRGVRPYRRGRVEQLGRPLRSPWRRPPARSRPAPRPRFESFRKSSSLGIRATVVVVFPAEPSSLSSLQPARPSSTTTAARSSRRVLTSGNLRSCGAGRTGREPCVPEGQAPRAPPGSLRGKRSAEPKCRRMARRRAGPTPGRVSKIDSNALVSRRRRWNRSAER